MSSFINSRRRRHMVLHVCCAYVTAGRKLKEVYSYASSESYDTRSPQALGK